MSAFEKNWKAKFALQSVGITLDRAQPYGEEFSALVRLLELLNVRSVIDVGANVGQFAAKLFYAGYPGSVVSFEPLPAEHAELQRNAKGNDRWLIAPAVALSDHEGVATFNIAGNSVSSSLLAMEDLHSEVAPQSRYNSQVEVKVNRLDNMLSAIQPTGDFFLKIDTQGNEKQVLEGAKAILPRVMGMKTEMSLHSLYKGQTLFLDLYAYILGLGLEPWDIRPGFRDKRTGRLLQCDGLFVRRECIAGIQEAISAACD